MRGNFQRRSSFSWVIWCSAFVIVTLLFAWKFEWFGHSSDESITETVPSSSVGEQESAANLLSSEGDNFSNTNILQLQTEPGAFPASVDRGSPHPRPKHPVWNEPRETSDPERLVPVQNYPDPPSAIKTVGHDSMEVTEPPRATLSGIDRLLQRGETLKAHEKLSNIYWKKPEWRSAIKQRINGVAERIYFSPQSHFLPPYIVRSGEKLSDIARQYRVTPEYLAILNQIMRPNSLEEGRRLKVLNGPFSAVVDLSDRRLTIHHQGWFVAEYRITLGTMHHKLDVGTKRVKEKSTNKNNAMVQQNPYGTHYIALDNSWVIHGTNNPDPLGDAPRGACISLHNSDIADVYNFLLKGADVLIQP